VDLLVVVLGGADDELGERVVVGNCGILDDSYRLLVPSSLAAPVATTMSPTSMSACRAPQVPQRRNVSTPTRELLDRDRGRRAADSGRTDREVGPVVARVDDLVLAVLRDEFAVVAEVRDSIDPSRVTGDDRDLVDVALFDQ